MESRGKRTWQLQKILSQIGLNDCGMATRLDKMCLVQQQNIQSRRPPQVKYSKNEIQSRVRKIPEIRFEDQRLTSFAGLVIF